MASRIACGEPSAAGATCTSAAANRHSTSSNMPIRPTRPLNPRASIRSTTSTAAGASPANHNRAATFCRATIDQAAKVAPSRGPLASRPVETTSGDSAGSCSAEFDSASRSRAAACVSAVRGGDRGTPVWTSKIRSRGYPAASNSRRAAGLLGHQGTRTQAGALDAAAAVDANLAETITMPAGPLRHEHHRRSAVPRPE